MKDPRETSAGSLMPGYPWLLEDRLDGHLTRDKVDAMRSLGVPYTDAQVASAEVDRDAQAKVIGDDLATSIGVKDAADKEIVALIAYLQRLGVDGRGAHAAGAGE